MNGAAVRKPPPLPLLFRRQLYRRGICCLPAMEQQIHHAPTALRNDNSSKMFEPRQYRDHTTVAFTAAGRIDFVSFRVEVCSEKVAPALHFRERGDWRVFV